MTALFFLRGVVLVGATILLAACDGGVVVNFSQPFPAQVSDMAAFPARHRGVYTAAASNVSFCISRTAVWQQQLLSNIVSRAQADSLHLPSADGTFRDEEGRLHHLRRMEQGAVHETWLQCDTVFTLVGASAGHLRRFQGRYYLNTPSEDPDSWQVQRLEITGPQLRWQAVGRDTLRLAALDAAAVHCHRDKGTTYCKIEPAAGRQTRDVGRYSGLWETAAEFRRRR